MKKFANFPHAVIHVFMSFGLVIQWQWSITSVTLCRCMCTIASLVLSHCSADLLSSGFEQTSHTAELLNDTRTNWCPLYSLPPFAASLYTQPVPLFSCPTHILNTTSSMTADRIVGGCRVEAPAFCEWKSRGASGQKLKTFFTERILPYVALEK